MTGSIVYATYQGLGILARDFYEHGVVDKVSVFHHKTRENHYDWYKEEDRYSIDELIEVCDDFLFFETFFDYSVLYKIQKLGKPMRIMPMYECTPYPVPVKIDEWLCPSALDYETYKDTENCRQVTVPVPDVILENARERQKARVFVHNAGNGGLSGRNGTDELLEAMKYVESPIQLIIRTQNREIKTNDERIKIVSGTLPYNELYQEGDVFIFPEKFNGLSLPLQEAYASGMAVMAGNRFPVNEWLPNEILIEPSGYKDEVVYKTVHKAEYDPKTIAKMVDDWFDKDISTLSKQGIQWGKDNSWKKQKKQYDTK